VLKLLTAMTAQLALMQGVEPLKMHTIYRALEN